MKPLASPSYRPLYDQIKILITQSLVAGEWRPGESIPSEIELAQRFNVSQGTVRKAIDALAAENIVVRRQGKGTFVASHSQERATTRFLRIVPDDGNIEFPQSEIVGFERIKAPDATQRALDLRGGSSVFVVYRLLRFHGVPTILDEIHLPCAQFKGLDEAMIRNHQGSFYGLLESKFNITMIRAEEHLKAVRAEGLAAKFLAVEEGAPLLCVDRIAFTYGDRPIERRRGLSITDAYSYVNEIS